MERSGGNPGHCDPRCLRTAAEARSGIRRNRNNPRSSTKLADGFGGRIGAVGLRWGMVERLGAGTAARDGPGPETVPWVTVVLPLCPMMCAMTQTPG